MQKYPLAWPLGWKRTKPHLRKQSNFTRKNASSGWRERLTVETGTRRLLDELGRFGVPAHHIIISTNLALRNDGLPRSNQAEPSDPGVAVYWRKSDKEQQHKVMATDIYDKVADNLAALAATIDAMRAIERHGGAVILDRAFTGFLALPAPNTWRSIMGYADEADPTLEQVKGLYRRLAFERHPDQGGSEAKMAELNWAMQEAERELGA